MKIQHLAALPLLALASCVTPGDLRDLADDYEHLGTVMADRDATSEDVAEAVDKLEQQLHETADLVEDRTTGILEGVSESGEAGIFSILAAVGLHFYRNGTRRKDLAKVAGNQEASV